MCERALCGYFKAYIHTWHARVISILTLHRSTRPHNIPVTVILTFSAKCLWILRSWKILKSARGVVVEGFIFLSCSIFYLDLQYFSFSMIFVFVFPFILYVFTSIPAACLVHTYLVSQRQAVADARKVLKNLWDLLTEMCWLEIFLWHQNFLMHPLDPMSCMQPGLNLELKECYRPS